MLPVERPFADALQQQRSMNQSNVHINARSEQVSINHAASAPTLCNSSAVLTRHGDSFARRRHKGTARQSQVISSIYSIRAQWSARNPARARRVETGSLAAELETRRRSPDIQNSCCSFFVLACFHSGRW